MERSAGEDEIADNGGAPTLTKRKRPAINVAASSAAAGVCDDDTVGSILARLPARTAIACTTLSKHHRSLIRSPEFRSLHCRLGAPLPSPHVAYLATAPIRQASGYYGFHLAGAGLTGCSGDAPIRSVAGWRYLGTKYVNTCNGVLLIATNGFSKQCRCILWNPAVADVAREVIPRPSPQKYKSEPFVLPDDGKAVELRYRETQFMPLGLGYGRRSNTYKLLLCRRNRSSIYRGKNSHGYHIEYSLLVYSLGGAATNTKETQLRTVPFTEIVLSCSAEADKEIFQNKSLYIDDKIYFPHMKKHAILAFDVDDETMRTIEANTHGQWVADKDLIEMSGRPCLVIARRDCIALWQLTANYELEPIHVISYKEVTNFFHHHTIVGIWDCGGVLFLWFGNRWFPGRMNIEKISQIVPNLNMWVLELL